MSKESTGYFDKAALSARFDYADYSRINIPDDVFHPAGQGMVAICLIRNSLKQAEFKVTGEQIVFRRLLPKIDCPGIYYPDFYVVDYSKKGQVFLLIGHLVKVSLILKDPSRWPEIPLFLDRLTKEK